jgi:hypothetical protein
MAEFVQIIRFKTDVDHDTLERMNAAYREATKGRATYTNDVFGRDLDTGEYVVIVTFPSREAADANNDLPETAANAEEMGKIASGPPSFSNIEVIERT